jgi:hypothetical protein
MAAEATWVNSLTSLPTHDGVTNPKCKSGEPVPVHLVDGTLFLLRSVSIPPLILGLPGNIMIILIASRKHNRTVSPSVYMIAMAIVDAILISLSAIFQPLYYGTNFITEREISNV